MVLTTFAETLTFRPMNASPVGRLQRDAFLILVALAILDPAALKARSPEGLRAARPILEREQVIGEWLSAQPFFYENGFTLFGGYTAEAWGNLAGGLDTGAVYSGLLDFGAELDLGELIGWDGASVSTTWLWMSGQDASAELVGNMFTVSNIAGFETLRMLELWFQQEMFDEKLSLRVGQLTADSEFFISDYGGLFINGTFGWPAVAYMNLPEGGPGYPMGAPGVRLAVSPVDWFTLQSAAFQGNVFAQDVNRRGFDWRLNAAVGYTFFNEAQFRWNHREEKTGLPGFFKLGVWFQTGAYADPLADSTDGGNAGYYAVTDQMLFRECGEPGVSEKCDEGLGCFQRIAFTAPDRNIVDLYFDTGLTYKGLIPRRDKDTVGMAFGYAQLSNGARDSLAHEGASPVGAEMGLEFTYQAAITPWFVVQPDLQYVINPGVTSDLGNALVIGCRVSITF